MVHAMALWALGHLHWACMAAFAAIAAAYVRSKRDDYWLD